MRIQVLQHVAFEGPAYFTEWATANSHSLEATHLYRKETPPEPDRYDWLVIMGGPMSVWEEKEHPWLLEEKRAIAAAIRAAENGGKRVIGICLGAQLIADVMGARVTSNQQSEIGWFPVEMNPELRERPDFAHWPEKQVFYHWHGDVLEPPRGAISMGSSEITPCQGFVYGDSVYAFQFHPELMRDGIEALLKQFGRKLKPSPSVQLPDQQRAHIDRFAKAGNRLLRGTLDQISPGPAPGV